MHLSQVYRLSTILFLAILLSTSGCMRKAPPPAEPAIDPLEQQALLQEEFIVNSVPSGATVRISTGESCRTPCTLSRKRRESFSVTVEKEGYRSETVKVTSNLDRILEFNRTKGTRDEVLGDVRVNTLRLTPNPVNVALQPAWEK